MTEERKMEFLWAPPSGEKVVGMIQFRNVIVVATTDGVYVMGDEDDVRHMKETPR